MLRTHFLPLDTALTVSAFEMETLPYEMPAGAFTMPADYMEDVHDDSEEGYSSSDLSDECDMDFSNSSDEQAVTDHLSNEQSRTSKCEEKQLYIMCIAAVMMRNNLSEL